MIASKLCRRFVADEPPQILVKRVAEVFVSSQGDLRQVMQALLTAPEFQSAPPQKFRRPTEFLVAACRALTVETDASTLVKSMQQLGQPFFGEPSPAGYPDVAEAWLTSSGLLARWNLATLLANGGPNGVSFDLDPLFGDASRSHDLAQRLVSTILPSYADGYLPQTLVELIGGGDLPADEARQRVPTAIAILLASPHFQWR